MLSTIFLFLNIGTGEMVLILFAALMLFGGEKLPGMARTLGKGIRDFKDASEDVKREINNQINSFSEKSETTTTTPVVEEHPKPLIEEYSTDETPVAESIDHHPNPVIAENKVPHAIPVSDIHVSTEEEPVVESRIDLNKH
ncbi:twin-arginine translocase TatA/TatE family subunit [Mucilaginibacter sp.]|jgi:sec-independent protein translocase protein TatA|uniref:Sec-independent protein translocase subunit TatA/TatB n=1 Tax=Mucilaginibacter sp. TaxID=1882438 RepID=UPI0025DFB2F1|nr:twin-arginine translocase TatA/TatE family subunit [Mucilaginibacter sp.]